MIDSDPKLAAWLPTLVRSPWVAVDTEADSLHAYPEKLCLLQVGTPERDVLLDPLARVDLAPLWEAFRGRELIMHGADYDLRLMHRAVRFVPDRVFDTMLAARLLGLTRFGLSDLVGSLLGVKLEKGPQKANWARRPLTPAMEAYARNDTRFLKPVADSLSAQLREKGRLSWHEETCARLIEECTQAPPPDPDLVWRVKGSHRLGRPGLAVLRALWNWREAEAVRSTRPPFFILSHEGLVALAEAAQEGRPVEPLLPPHFSERRREALSHALREGIATPPAAMPRRPRPGGHRPTASEKRRYLDLERRRDLKASELGLDPALIAPRATLSMLAHDEDPSALRLMNWQRALLEG